MMRQLFNHRHRGSQQGPYKALVGPLETLIGSGEGEVTMQPLGLVDDDDDNDDGDDNADGGRWS